MPEENFVEEIIEDVEDIFDPKPGGIIDRYHQEKARREAAQREAENAAEKIEENASFAVKVTPISPEVMIPNAVTIPSGGSVQILPLNKYRYRASISVDTAASKIVLCKDSGSALGGVGFTLASGIIMSLTSRAQLYAFNPGGADVTISVLSEIYAPETS